MDEDKYFDFLNGKYRDFLKDLILQRQRLGEPRSFYTDEERDEVKLMEKLLRFYNLLQKSPHPTLAELHKVLTPKSDEDDGGSGSDTRDEPEDPEPSKKKQSPLKKKVQTKNKLFMETLESLRSSSWVRVK